MNAMNATPALLARPGLVIFAHDLPRLASFYAGLLDTVPEEVAPGHLHLSLPGLDLTLVAIPAHIAATFEISRPPALRDETALKPMLPVPSLAAARAVAPGLGGGVDPAEREWRAGTVMQVNGHDPEGNVFGLTAALDMAPAMQRPAPAFPTLGTSRLQLREITQADAPALLALHGDAALMRWYGSEPLASLAAAQGLVRVFDGWRQQANPGVRWGLVRTEDEATLLGTCGLFGWNRTWRKCTLGYELAAAAQGQGLMREALAAALDWGFVAMDLNRVEALVHPDNAPSIAVLQRLGFVQEGRLRQVARFGGQQHDMLQWALLREDWPGASGLGQA